MQWASLQSQLAPVQYGRQQKPYDFDAPMKGFMQGRQMKREDDRFAFQKKQSEAAAQRAASALQMQRERLNFHRQQAERSAERDKQRFAFQQKQWDFKLKGYQDQQAQRERQQAARKKAAQLYAEGNHNGAALEMFRSGGMDYSRLSGLDDQAIARQSAQINLAQRTEDFLTNLQLSPDPAQATQQFDEVLKGLQARGIDVSQYRGGGAAARMRMLQEMRRRKSEEQALLAQMKAANERRKLMLQDGRLSLDQDRLELDREKLKQPEPSSLGSTEQKMIVEADDAAQKTESAISSIQTALSLNDKAFDGPYSREQAEMLAMTGLYKESSQATIRFDNLVQAQALQQLRAIFGGNPTEGERQILMQIQGSSSQPREVRKQILDEALALAKQRLATYRQRAQAIRSGEYFTPQFRQQQAAPTAPQAPTTSPAAPPQPRPPQTPPVPPAAIQFLQQNANNPDVIRQFESKYGVPAQGFIANQ